MAAREEFIVAAQRKAVSESGLSELLAHAMERAVIISVQKLLAIVVVVTGFVVTESSLQSPAFAQDNSSKSEGTPGTEEIASTPPTAEGNQPKSEPDMIDEISVIASKSLSTLRRELVEAEDEIYETFNSLNHDDDYDIICKKETRIGSQIPYRVCKARIYRESLAETAQDYVDKGGPYGATLNAREHSEVLQEKMRSLAAENPQLVEALKKRLALQKECRLQREQKFQN